jgi:starch synthase
LDRPRQRAEVLLHRAALGSKLLRPGPAVRIRGRPGAVRLFSKAALEFLFKAGKRPDVIHCHDWQTGLVPVLLYEQYGHVMPHQRVCYTIHNFRHQGTGDERVLWATQLGRPDHFLDADRMGDDFRYRGLNPMKGGVVYSNFVTTVSPSHADEAMYDDGACGLGRTLKEHRAKFRGVLNGVDYEAWNPEIDASADPLFGRRHRGQVLLPPGAQGPVLAAQGRRPVVAYVGRLDEQKGMHLVQHALHYTLARAGQFVLIGDADHDGGIIDRFRRLKDTLNDNPDCHLEIGYREDLAHLVYAGADLLVVPSMFEPCGLAPLIGMRYGTVPVVRATGGMNDTVFDRDHSGRLAGERNGFVFDHTDGRAIESALSRALALWFNCARDFRAIVTNCMRADYSWTRPGREYVDIYQKIQHK